MSDEHDPRMDAGDQTIPEQATAAYPPHRPRRVDPLLGRTIAGRYEVVERIGAGGMGVVYRAYQAAMDRDVALKVLSTSLAADEQSVRRFNQEARAASRLRHPNTITLHDFGKTEDDILFIAMEFLDGTSLNEVMEVPGGMGLARAITVLAQVCRSLAEAHEAGIIHRDLKPDNIFLCELGGEKDFVKVLDFGVAKLREADPDGGTLTQAGMIFGTPRYMSPEQAQSGDLDPRSDLYALGVILYEMLTGRAPFQAESPLSILICHVNDPPPPFPSGVADNIPASLERLTFDLLEKDPDRRPASAKALLKRLRDIATELQTGGPGRAAGTGLSGLSSLSALDSFEAPGRATTADPGPSALGDPGSAGDTARSADSAEKGWADSLGERPSLPHAPGQAAGSRWFGGVGLLAIVGVIAGLLLTGRDHAPDPTPTEGVPAQAPASTANAVTAPTPARSPAPAPEASQPPTPSPTPSPPPSKPKAPRARPSAAKRKPNTAKPKPARPAAAEVAITLATIPAGAEVRQAGRFLGLTPVTLQRTKSAKAETFQLSKKGYLPTKALAVMSEDRRITKRLEKEGGP